MGTKMKAFEVVFQREGSDQPANDKDVAWSVCEVKLTGMNLDALM